ncbi:divalent cation tolerance protein CutA [Cystobacter fuscus]
MLCGALAGQAEQVGERSVSYECPEVLRLDVAAGHAPYLQWIADNVRAGP